ncbi:MAG: acetyl-CoA carboxylase biotin carboxylase subunit [Sphingomonadales bacterium]|nr:acetyl-CoA carboxylase biotin carboxylase subunit [Sphingomonadales bacterium]
MRPIRRLLIANRGEIALRIMRTCREMGIVTLAVYSEADRLSPHALFADEAYCVGPPPSRNSYLRGDYLIELAIRHKVDAIHPGYGFLSERPEFARAVEEAGLILVGPSARSMELMGNKLAARHTVADFQIPMVPGSPRAINDPIQAIEIAKEIGFPVLLKAAAGGGGKGMRVVESANEFAEQLERAHSEALSAFGDDAVFVEKYLAAPRHIEIQLIGDQHGNILYLFERECSIQRRHQKLVEEAPSSCLTPEVRRTMGEAAVRVAKACGYYNAGTVEFLVDEKLNFYFLEMNTRLQVEHPVTEMITGLDLVRLQIHVAEGHPLPIKQEDLQINGHAIELRVCAEDPLQQFLPDTGTLDRYRRPQGPGVRVDDGFREGMEVPVHYDSMLSKLVVHASNREEAIERMIRAVQEYEIKGVSTTLPFGLFVMRHPAFRSGQFDTGFITKYIHGKTLYPQPSKEQLRVAALTAAWHQEQQQTDPSGRQLVGQQPTSEPSNNALHTQAGNGTDISSNGFTPWRINRGF